MEDVRIVVNGLGAAGTACCRILLAAGACHLVGCDKEGIVLMGRRRNSAACHTDFAGLYPARSATRHLARRVEGADVFIGLSVGNVLQEDLERMNQDRIVFRHGQS